MLQTIPSQILSSEHIKQNMKVVIIEKHGFSIPFLRRKAPLARSHGFLKAKLHRKGCTERLYHNLAGLPSQDGILANESFFFSFRICEAFQISCHPGGDFFWQGDSRS